MKYIAQLFGVTICGLFTSVVTALLVVAVSELTGFNFFTFSIWFVVPIGAVLTGFAAASGYYLGSFYLHKRANWSLLIQMVVIAGITQFLIYYGEYLTLKLEDGTIVSNVIGFSQYLDVSLTSAHYVVGNGVADTGEVGSLGYWLAFLQFIGFLVGGLCVYGLLVTKAVCKSCNMYLSKLSKRKKVFKNSNSASEYYDVVFKHPIDSPEFSALIRKNENAAAEKGSVLVTTILQGCQQCKLQQIEETLKVYNGNEWKSINDLDRRVNIPQGMDLLAVFKN